MTTADERPPEDRVPSLVATDANESGVERPGPQQIQADIEETRQELGETVEALSAKLDVKARAGRRLGAAKAQAVQRADVARRRSADLVTRVSEAATDQHGRPKPAVPIAAGMVVVAVAAAVVWQRRHHG